MKENNNVGNSESKLWKRILLNPFYIYSISFLIALNLYAFEWIDYPTISTSLLSFIIFSIVLSIILANIPLFRFFFKSKNTLLNNDFLIKLFRLLLVPVIIGFAISYIAKGSLFWKIFISEDVINYSYDILSIRYLTHSVQVLDVVIFLFSLHFYLDSRDKRYVFLLLVTMIPMILQYNRFYATQFIVPSIFIFIYHYKGNFLRLFLILFLSISILGLLFGIAGNYREKAKGRDYVHLYEELEIKNYPIWLPRDFVWFYFYASSPIAKLQYSINDEQLRVDKDFSGLFVHALLPESLGFRINKFFKSEYRRSSYVYPEYYVGTIFYDSYCYAQWFGMFITLFIIMGGISFIMYFLKSSDNFWYYIPILSILNSMTIFMPFGNVLALSTTNAILYFSILLTYVIVKLSKKQNKLVSL